MRQLFAVGYINVHTNMAGFHKWGIPQNGWFTRNIPLNGWFGGTPISGNHHMLSPNKRLLFLAFWWVPWLPGKLLNTVERPRGTWMHWLVGARKAGWCHGYFVVDWLFSWICCWIIAIIPVFPLNDLTDQYLSWPMWLQMSKGWLNRGAWFGLNLSTIKYHSAIRNVAQNCPIQSINI